MHLGTSDNGYDLVHSWGLHLGAVGRQGDPDPEDEEPVQS